MAERGWRVERHDDHFTQDTPDTELLARVAERGWVLVTQDRKIRTRGPERRILLDTGLATISIASTANLSSQQTIEVLQKAEPKLLPEIARLTSPFILALYKDGSFKELALSDADLPVE